MSRRHIISGSSKPKEIISHGEIVWGLFEVESDYKPANKPRQRPQYIIIECAIRWRVRDHKIIEHQAFFDTASLLVQQGELPILRVRDATLGVEGVLGRDRVRPC